MSSIDLISLKIQILGGKVLFKNPGFKSLWGRVKFFAIFIFLFTFLILSIKNWILKHKLPFLYTHKILFCIFFYQLNINKNRFIMDKIKKVKKKRKMAKNLTLPHGDLNPGFLNKTFPPKIWILREIRSIELTVLKKSWL